MALAGWGGLIAQGIGNTVSALGSFSVTKHQNAAAQAQAKSSKNCSRFLTIVLR